MIRLLNYIKVHCSARPPIIRFARTAMR